MMTIVFIIALTIILSGLLFEIYCIYKNETKLSQVAISKNEPQAVNVSNWDLDKVKIVRSADGYEVPVPKGFFASELEGENRVRTGFVIYSGDEPISGVDGETIGTYSTDPNSYWQASCNRNQYVWIPCTTPSRIYKIDSVTGKKKRILWEYSYTSNPVRSEKDYDYYRTEPTYIEHEKQNAEYWNERLLSKYNLSELSLSRLVENFELEFESTMESIEKYGGFYIGRYETGNTYDFENNCYSKKPVVRRMNTNILYEKWEDAYRNVTNIEENENIKVNLIWSCLWDETLQWLVDSKNKTTYQIANNATSWGNHTNVSFQYTNIDGEIVIKPKTDRGIITLIPTGSSEYTKANNIYNLSGNVTEWTLAKDYWKYNVSRGGYSSFTTGIYGNSSLPISSTYKKGETGARAFFYIK